MKKIEEILANNSYPGRGIIVGKTKDGANAVLAYFIMGRSENSRNRVFVNDGDGIKTQAFDESKLTDPSLIIYSPVRVIGYNTIVTNGDQTDTIYKYLKKSGSSRDALRTRAFEPDAPNFTPRISAVASFEEGAFSYELSILKSAMGNAESCERFFYEYKTPLCGQGRFIHTYECDGDPIPSFCGEPRAVEIEGTIQQFADLLWSNLNEDNKVSLFVRYVDIATKEAQTILINKNN